MVISENLLYAMGANIKDYSPSETIFNEGDVPHYYYQIITGEVKLNNYNEEGKEFIQNILSEGQSCGESLLFTNKTYPMNAVTLTHCSILKLSKTNFLKLLDTHPELYLNICRFLSERLYYKYIMLQNNSLQSPKERLRGLMDYLKSFQEDRLKFSFQVPLTRQQLASLTGLCVETAIRTIKDMERNNIVKIHDRKILY